uniref:G-protein coupled receptors family 1 profile domain-containing protein n=1 Tax=Propithecus coquereli TaxID=379532 RepID=A0A2K6GT20_PROCO
MLCHCGGQLRVTLIPLCAEHSCRVRRPQNLLSGPWTKQPMEFHNLSSLSLSLPIFCSPHPSALLASLPPHLFPLVSVFLAPVLGVEFVLGLAGNSLALFVFCFHTRPWTSSMVFLVSLVVADFLLIISLPLHEDYYFLHETRHFGAAAHKVNLFMMFTNHTASAAFPTTILLNCYGTVVQPTPRWGQPPRWPGGSGGASCSSSGHRALASLHWHQALYTLEFFLLLARTRFAVVSVRAELRKAVCLLAMMVAIYTICFLPSIVFGTASAVRLPLPGRLALGPALFSFCSPNVLPQSLRARGWQGPLSDEGACQPSPWRGRPREAEGPSQD